MQKEMKTDALKLALEKQSGFFSREAMRAHSDCPDYATPPAQPEQEPVGEAHLMQEGFTHCIWSESVVPVGTKFYTTPQRPWVELTDEDVEIINGNTWDVREAARMASAKSKEKNA